MAKSANIFSLLQTDPEPEPSLPEKKPVSYSTWGTPEERYRHLCMLCLLCRYAYYIHSMSIVSDKQYDRLESTIRDIEERNRAMIHRKSPTYRVGSSQEFDYPPSVRMLWLSYEGDRESLLLVSTVIDRTLDQAVKDWCL